MLPLHMTASSIATYIILPLPPFMVSTISKAALNLMKSPLGNIIPALIDASGIGPTRNQRHSGTFEVVCIGIYENARESVSVWAADPYGLTAVIAAGVARHIEHKGSAAAGPVAPSMVAGYHLIRELTRRAGARWTRQR